MENLKNKEFHQANLEKDNKLLHKSIDWFITKKCNSISCPFCYAPYDLFGEDVGIEAALKICDELIKKEVDFVTLCGGEPLLFPYITEVIEYLYKNNVKVILTTGLLVDNVIERISKIEDYLYMLSIPIDAITDSTKTLLRGCYVFDIAKNLLERYKSKHMSPKIKIGTVVNAINISEIPDIYKFIYSYKELSITWRLYMFSPFGLGEKNQQLLLISLEEFEKIISTIYAMNVKCGEPISISGRNRNDNIGYCMLMNSSGDFFLYNEDYIKLDVSIYDSYIEIVKMYDLKKYNEQKNWQIL